jgi:HPt (histidine-containing phosphotransfer) domain-containing protein
MRFEQGVSSYQINPEILLELGDDNEFLVELIECYNKQTPEFIEKLSDYLQTNDLKGIKEICHQIKSSYGIVRMPELEKSLQVMSETLQEEAPQIKKVSYSVNVIILLISIITEEVKRLADR